MQLLITCQPAEWHLASSAVSPWHPANSGPASSIQPTAHSSTAFRVMLQGIKQAFAWFGSAVLAPPSPQDLLLCHRGSGSSSLSCLGQPYSAANKKHQCAIKTVQLKLGPFVIVEVGRPVCIKWFRYDCLLSDRKCHTADNSLMRVRKLMNKLPKKDTQILHKIFLAMLDNPFFVMWKTCYDLLLWHLFFF